MRDTNTERLRDGEIRVFREMGKKIEKRGAAEYTSYT
jgi:hypothetical protein